MAQLLGIFGFVVVLLRAAILCSQTVAMGGVLFLVLVAGGPEEGNESWREACWKLIRRSAAALAIAQLFFIVTNSLVLRYSTEVPLKDVLNANFAWAGALAIGAGAALVWFSRALQKAPKSLMLLPCGVMLVASVMTSHSASRMDNRALLVALTAAHYLATASWIGGLPYLVLTLRRMDGPGSKAAIGRRFSILAQASVALLFLAGFGMSYVYVGSWAALYGTAYGVMLGAKLVLFAVLLLIGAANFYIVRDIQRDGGTGARSLLRFGEVEIGIGLSVILVAASMTSQPPGSDLAQDRVSLQEIVDRFGPRMPRFSSPDLTQISQSSKELAKRLVAQGKTLPSQFIPGKSEFNNDTPADRAWSEYNHSCAGLIVFLMGILALLSRSRYFRWAKIWPLAFLLLAGFLFFRADAENWPMGPNSFWESFFEADVLQHRVAVALIIAFAVFQYRVEMKWVKSTTAALIFPMVCAAGGVVLLTHTHALTNVKEELLTELSHTPLAVVGILAGWSRYLELRLPEGDRTRKYLAWVWPVCFIVIGMILMDYHET